MHARRLRNEVTGVAEVRRHHPFNVIYDTREELFFGVYDIRGIHGVGVLINTSLAIQSYN